MPDDQPPERPVGAMAGPARALSVDTTGVLNREMRPADWNSGENNNQFYPDPGELAWERVKAMEAENPNPNPEGAANGSAAMPEPAVPKRKRGRPPKSHSDASPRAAGGDHVPVSDVSRSRDADPDELQETRQPPANRGREVAKVGRDLSPAVVKESKANKARIEATLGMDAFERFVQEAPLKDAFDLYNEYSRRLVDAGYAIEARRNSETKFDRSCTFCEHEFSYRGSDVHYGRRQFDLPGGRTEVIMCCRKERCQVAFDERVNEMSAASRAVLRE